MFEDVFRYRVSSYPCPRESGSRPLLTEHLIQSLVFERVEVKITAG
jgi:hypothetical protein